MQNDYTKTLTDLALSGENSQQSAAKAQEMAQEIARKIANQVAEAGLSKVDFLPLPDNTIEVRPQRPASRYRVHKALHDTEPSLYRDGMNGLECVSSLDIYNAATRQRITAHFISELPELLKQIQHTSSQIETQNAQVLESVAKAHELLIKEPTEAEQSARNAVAQLMENGHKHGKHAQEAKRSARQVAELLTEILPACKLPRGYSIVSLRHPDDNQTNYRYLAAPGPDYFMFDGGNIQPNATANQVRQLAKDIQEGWLLEIAQQLKEQGEQHANAAAILTTASENFNRASAQQ